MKIALSTHPLFCAALLAVPLSLLACNGAVDDASTGSLSAGVTAAGVCESVAPPIVGRSLFVTDPTVLAQFPIGAVLNQIASSGDTTGKLTGIKLYQQMLDIFNGKAGTIDGPHCTGLVNDFPTTCTRPEGRLSSTDPTSSGPDGYIPLGVVNRFDLAPANGANCGQYRVVYGKRSGQFNPIDRTLIIFEAVLPNPAPAKGIASCQPVVEMWNQLSASDVTIELAAVRLAAFYFRGLPGFAPVIQAAHYGFGSTANTGQIRMNTFNGDWQLREFRLEQTCEAEGDAGSKCSLLAHNRMVQNNPEGSLFGDNNTESLAFQKQFISQVPSLAASDLNLIGMSTPTVDTAGMSDEQSSQSDYLNNGQGNASLTAAITAELKRIGRTDLTADNILDRATTQGCAGCHELSPGRAMGGGLPAWPSTNGFTQIDELSRLSPALTGTFLPFRSLVMVEFLEKQCASSGQVVGGGDTAALTGTIGGGVVGSAN